jgi:predicted MFS family arabinose efflux permease
MTVAASPLQGRERLPQPSRQSLRGLDWFVFCLADVQTGFGPFVAVYLTTQKWTQIDIGVILTVSGLVALAGQMPGGALVDAARSERFVAALAIVAISLSALAYAIWPVFGIVIAAAVLHAAASCVLGPAIAAISLGLVGHFAVSERLGRNARFASIGSGLAAAGMGAAGYLISSRAVFLVTVALCVPTLFALSRICANEIDAERAHGGKPVPHPGEPTATLRELLRNRALVIFATCAMLFHLANAAMLPLVASIVTMRSTQWATALVGACIVVPQVVVAALSPWVGRRAQQWGRRPLVLLGFAVLPIRGLLFALAADPYLLVAVQILDGISAAVFAVMMPLVIADVTRGTGHFNLAQGIVGSGVGIGASLSMMLAGYMSDRFGGASAFYGLAGLAASGFVLILALMPETRPQAFVARSGPPRGAT